MKNKLSVIENLVRSTASISESNGTRYFKKRCYRIGIISDEYFFNSIKDSAEFKYITKNNWKETIEKGIDLLFFETPWTGINDEWIGIAWPGSNKAKEILFEIIKQCNSKGVPTIFYSKEDPPDFYTFLGLAKLFDFVFTTCEECVDKYKHILNHKNVFALPFCFNPIYNNPIGISKDKQLDKVLFAGSWYSDFNERCLDQRMIFDGVMLSEEERLFIIDRNYSDAKPSLFPKKYHRFIYPGIQHNILQKLHKLFRWAINVNSIKDSKTMFANRTFELSANGNLVISNYSLGVNNILPNIFIAPNKEIIPFLLDSLTLDEKYELQIASVRSVMSSHTCFHRIEEFLDPIGMSKPIKNASVLVVLEHDTCLKDFERQTYKHKHFIMARDLQTTEVSDYDIITWFSNKYSYSLFYIEDLCNAFKYTSASYVTKNNINKSEKYSGIENNYTNKMMSKYLTLFWVNDFEPSFLFNIEGELIIENGYSSDALSVVVSDK